MARLRLAPALAVAAVVSSCVHQDPAGPQRLRQLFHRLHAEGRFHGTVLVAERGEVVFEAGHGLADDAAPRPVTADTAFDYASVAKPIVAVAVLRLARRGAFALDDSVAMHLPDFPYRAVTIRQLLQHTSGLPGHLTLFGEHRAEIARHDGERALPITNDDVLRFLATARLPAEAAPGTRWSYDNVNYIVLGALLARATGKPTGTALRELVFAPAGMHGAWALPDDRPVGGTVRHLATDYVRTPDGTSWLPRATAPGWEFVRELGGTVGDGGIAGTARDLLAFERALADDTLLPSESRAAMWTPAVLADGTPVENRGWTTSSYGLGWTLAPDGSAVWHTGDWGGFLTCLKRFVATDRTLVYLIHRRTDDWSWLGDVEAILTAPTPLR